MIQNVIVGRPLIGTPAELFGSSLEDWVLNESEVTLLTEERFLPRILVEAGIAKSTSEVRRNRPDLWRELNELDFFQVKWGKKFLWILVGE